MAASFLCPRCGVSLPADATRPEVHSCDQCGGWFVSGRVISEPASPPIPGETGSPSCPACGTTLTVVPEEATLPLPALHCAACGGHWTDGHAAIVPPAAPTPGAAASQPVSAITRNFLFGLSLPERVVRSAVGLTAGTVRELAGFVVPQAFQTSKSYEIAITNSLGFLTDTVGGAAAAKSADDEAGEFVARKAVGNFIDLAGLATLHASPMWVLAVVSDVCYGTKTYVQEVARELQAQGVIDDASTIHHVDDILEAIQRAAGSAASTFDQPPLSVDELRRTVVETREALSQADVRKLLPQAELQGYWNEMRSVAKAEGVSMLDVSAAVTMNTLNRVKTVSQGALTGLRVAGGLLNRNVLTHYSESLGRVRDRGLYETVRESYQPYVAAVWRNFSTEKKSWTEKLLDPGHVSRGWDKVWGLFGEGRGGDPSVDPPPPPSA